MSPGFPDALRSAARRFVNAYRGRLRLFDDEREVAPGVIVQRTGGHTPGHSVVRISSGDERLMFAGDAIFAVGRSEEHTSELQSLMRISYAVFCLKKKTKENKDTK